MAISFSHGNLSLCLGLLLRPAKAGQEVRQEYIIPEQEAGYLPHRGSESVVPFIAPAEAPVPVPFSAECPVPLQPPLLQLPGEPHRSGKPLVYLCELGLTLWCCGRPPPVPLLPA